jgi:hypothetical protein
MISIGLTRECPRVAANVQYNNTNIYSTKQLKRTVTPRVMETLIKAINK